MAGELKYPQAFKLPEHGGFNDLYDLSSITGTDMKEENIEGLAFVGKDIVQIITPNFEVTPPNKIIFKQVDSTTHKWTMQTVLDGKTYIREFIITTDGSTEQNVLSMKLPSGHVIEFVNE